MLANKDADGFIAAIAPHVSHLVAVPIPGHDHHPADGLMAMAKAHGIMQAESASDVGAAFVVYQ